MGILSGILWMVLNIILVILAVLVLILLVILIVPLRYHISGRKEEEAITADASVTFLLKALSLDVRYQKEKETVSGPDISFRIFGISPREVKAKRAERKKQKRRELKKKKIEAIRKADPVRYEEMKEEARERKEARRKSEEEAAAKKAAEEAARMEQDEKQETVKKKSLKRRLQLRIRKSFGLLSRLSMTLFDLAFRLSGILFDALTFLTAIPARIVDEVFKIISKVADMYDTISKYAGFAADPRTAGAVAAVKKRAFAVLRHIFPKTLSGQVVFGLDDPAGTGQILAAGAALYPLYGDRLQLTPDFSGKRLEGNLSAGGRIRIGTVALQALLLIANKDVRFVWRTYKQFKNGRGSDSEAEAA